MKLSAELSLSEIVYDQRQIARAGLEDHFCGSFQRIPFGRGDHGGERVLMDASPIFHDEARSCRSLGLRPAHEMETWRIDMKMMMSSVG